MGKNKDLKNIKLSDIELGNADGEKESSNKNFQGYFYERHSDYTLLKNNNDKFIVTGKKGSGKTYLVKYLENNVKKQGVLSKTIKWKDINLNSLIELGKQKVDCECESFYNYIILIEIARLILGRTMPSIMTKTKNPLKIIGFYLKKRKLKKFYKKRYPDGNYSISRIKTKDRNLEKVDMNASLDGLSSTNFSEKEKEKETEYREKNTYEIIRELEKLIFQCLKYISVVLISDDLDEQGLNVLSNKNFRIFLIHYLNAANNLNLKFKLYDSKVIIVIRDDILDTLNAQSSNINKLITDSTIQIDWCEKSRKKFGNMTFRR